VSAAAKMWGFPSFLDHLFGCGWSFPTCRAPTKTWRSGGAILDHAPGTAFDYRSFVHAGILPLSSAEVNQYSMDE